MIYRRNIQKRFQETSEKNNLKKIILKKKNIRKTCDTIMEKFYEIFLDDYLLEQSKRLVEWIPGGILERAPKVFFKNLWKKNFLRNTSRKPSKNSCKTSSIHVILLEKFLNKSFTKSWRYFWVTTDAPFGETSLWIIGVLKSFKKNICISFRTNLCKIF